MMKPMNDESALRERSAPVSAPSQFPTMPHILLDQLPVGLSYKDRRDVTYS